MVPDFADCWYRSGLLLKDTNGYTVYITKTGEKYHSGGCRYLKKSKIAIDINDARAQGYEPCSVCNP